MSLPFFREYQHPTTYIILFHQCLSHETHRLLFTTLSPSCQWTSLLALSLKMVRSEWLFLPAHQVPASKTVNNGQLTVDNVSRSTLSTSCFFSVFQNFLANPTGSQILKIFLLPLSTANWIIANCLKWRISDSNRWPPACKAGALASWANPPCQFSNCLIRQLVALYQHSILTSRNCQLTICPIAHNSCGPAWTRTTDLYIISVAL